MRKPLEPRMIAALFAVAVVFLSWVSLASFWSTHSLLGSFEADNAAHQVLEKLQHIDVLMEAAESGVRGFAITGDRRQLDSYRYARLVVPYEMKQIESSLLTLPGRKRTWQRLDRLLSSRLAQMAAIVARRTSPRTAEARRIQNDADKTKRNSMEHLLSELQQEERMQLDLLRLRVSDHEWKTDAALLFGTLVSLALLAWAFTLVRRVADERRLAEYASQRTETFLDSIIERIPYMILVKEAQNLRLTLVNKAAELWFGKSRKELLGSNDLDLRPEREALAAIDKDRAILREGKLADIAEEPLALPGQEGRILHTQKIPVPDQEGNPGYLLTISEDITQRKQAEKMLELSRDAAVESARLKSEFIRNMSHEIRTPLSVVSGMTELLLGTPLTPEQQRFASMVHRAAEGLSDLSKSILDFSRIEAGAFSLDIQDLRLRPVVEEVIAMLAKQASAKGVNLVSIIDPALPATVRGDPARLRQVLTHLIGNAVKFTEKGEIIVRVSQGKPATGERPPERAVQPEPYWVHVRITDTGIGIPEAVQPHLFEPFRQGDGSATRKFGGTGLGLAISRRILELMGGEMGFASRVGQGSTFWLTVPFQPSVQPGAAGDPAPLAGMRARILVADENETVRQMLQQQFRSWALSGEAVSSGEAALELLRREQKAGRPYPLVLLDMHLPDMDAVIFARKLRAEPDLAGTQLIVMAPPGSALEPAAAVTLGFAGQTTKPPQFEELHSLLASLLGADKTLDQRQVS